MNLGCRLGFKKSSYQSRVKITYDNLTDISDIASLPASLFSTPVKLSGPFLLNFLSPIRIVIMHLNVEMRAIIYEFPFIIFLD